MAKLTVVVAAPDPEYLRLLSQYAQSQEAGRRVQLECLTSKEHLEQWSAANTADVVLVDREWMREGGWTSRLHAPVIGVLTDRREEVTAESPLPSVFKYQSAASLLSLLEKWHGDRLRGDDGERDASAVAAPRTVAVYSAVGGCGKTTFAVNLCKVLAQRGHSALYVSLEPLGTLDTLLDVRDPAAFSKALYRIQSGREIDAAEWAGLLHRDDHSGISYLPPVLHEEDAEAMEEETAVSLVKSLRRAAGAELIVFDLDSTAHPRIRGALAACDAVYWLVNDEAACVAKTGKRWQRWNRELRGVHPPLAAKTRWIWNRSSGGKPVLLDRLGIRFSGRLPYIPEWKRPEEHTLRSVLYDEHVLRLHMSGEKGRKADGQLVLRA